MKLATPLDTPRPACASLAGIFLLGLSRSVDAAGVTGVAHRMLGADGAVLDGPGWQLTSLVGGRRLIDGNHGESRPEGLPQTSGSGRGVRQPIAAGARTLPGGGPNPAFPSSRSGGRITSLSETIVVHVSPCQFQASISFSRSFIHTCVKRVSKISGRYISPTLLQLCATFCEDAQPSLPPATTSTTTHHTHS